MEKDISEFSYETAIEGYKLFFLMQMTADAVYKLRETELKKFDISPQQALALICIYSLKNKATPAEVSRWLYREPNSITILLNRMEKLDLIKKKADLKRKNIIRLSLTKKGIKAYQHAIEFETFASLINMLSERRRSQLFANLQLIREEVFNRLHLDAKIFSIHMDKAVFDPLNSKRNINEGNENGTLPLGAD
jgi:DNA-binding MarR family transcriptional regulator